MLHPQYAAVLVVFVPLGVGTAVEGVVAYAYWVHLVPSVRAALVGAFPRAVRRLFQAYVQLIAVGCAYLSAIAETNVDGAATKAYLFQSNHSRLYS